MRTSKTNASNSTSIALAICLMMAMFTLISANALFAKREFRGRAEIQFCKKTANGQWEVADRFIIPNLQFTLSVADVAFGKEFKTESIWEGTSEKGRRIRVSLNGLGKAKVNRSGNTADLEVDVPFNVTVDGHTFNQTFHATTGSAQGPSGILNGKRAEINPSANSIIAILIGVREVQVPVELISDGTSNTKKPGKPTETILVVGTLTARLTTVN
ncbi:MAG: hypothetical protein AB1757_09755 [Acidobacteriota bacterium]